MMSAVGGRDARGGGEFPGWVITGGEVSSGGGGDKRVGG